jgi:hypothetical protein
LSAVPETPPKLGIEESALRSVECTARASERSASTFRDRRRFPRPKSHATTSPSAKEQSGERETSKPLPMSALIPQGIFGFCRRLLAAEPCFGQETPSLAPLSSSQYSACATLALCVCQAVGAERIINGTAASWGWYSGEGIRLRHRLGLFSTETSGRTARSHWMRTRHCPRGAFGSRWKRWRRPRHHLSGSRTRRGWTTAFPHQWICLISVRPSLSSLDRASRVCQSRSRTSGRNRDDLFGLIASTVGISCPADPP